MSESLRQKLRMKLSRIHRGAAVAYVSVALVAFAVGALSFRAGTHPDHGPQSAPNAHGDHVDEPADATIWTCAMHPQIRQSEPGQCPICGMDLIPVESNGALSDGHGAPTPERVSLSERARALARLRTTEVRRQADPTADVRLLGRIEPDETTSRTVTAWVGGRIDRLHVRVTGERVRAGQPIGTNGDTGNARGTPHLHLEVHPGGGRPINPYPLVQRACG
jgi:membrane fusion protein, copper/silver efflux system